MIYLRPEPRKIKHIVNNSNYGVETKVQKLAPIVKGWRNYHRYCKIDGSRFKLWLLSNKTFKKILKQKNSQSSFSHCKLLKEQIH
jgi:RNA-directed DNA polymerase